MALLGPDYGNVGVSYVISARDVSQAAIDSAVSGVKRVQTTTDRMAAQMKSRLAYLQKHWLGLSATIAGVAIAVKKAWDLAGRAADYQEQVAVLNALGTQYGQTGDQIVNMMKQSARGLVSMEEAASMAANALNKGLSTEQLYRFTQAAETLTDVTGDKIPDAFNRMVTAAATGRTQTLADMGVIVDLKKAYDTYAQSLGKTAKQLTEQEKLQARVTVILGKFEEKTRALGPTVDTNRDKMDRLMASLKDLQLMLGQGLIRAALGAKGAFEWLSSGALNLWGYIQKLMGGWAKLMSYLTAGDLKASWLRDAEAYKANAETAFGASQEMMDRSMASFEGMLAKSTELAAAQSGLKQQIREEEAAAQAEADLGEMETQQQKLARLASYYAVTAQMAATARKAEETAEKKRLATVKAAAAAEKKLRQDVTTNAISLLMMLGEKHKAFALLGIAISTGMEMIRAWQVTQTAAMLAFSSQLIPGDPTSIARAEAAYAATQAMGVINVALIGAAGVMRGIAAMSGGASQTGGVAGYSPTSPTETINDAREEDLAETEEKAARTIIINNHIYGNVVDQDKFAREILPAMRKAEADGA